MEVPFEELRYVLHEVDAYCRSHDKELRRVLHEKGSLNIMKPPRFYMTSVRNGEDARPRPTIMEVYEVKMNRSGEVVLRIPNAQN